MRALLLPGIQCKGFESAKTEIQSGPVGHRPWKGKDTRLARLRSLRQCGATRVAHTQHFCGLVERLARRIIQALANNFIISNSTYVGQQRMAAGYQQRHERKLGCLIFQQRRQQVALHVMHLYCRNIQCPGQAACNRCARH